MKPFFDQRNIRYVSKPITAISFFLFVILALFLFWGRKHVGLRPEFLLAMMPGFYQHVSNYSISCLVYGGAGFMWLHFGLPFKFIAGLGAIMLAINFVYELWIPVLNTPDIIDAYFGAAGTLLSCLFLWIANVVGMKKNILQDNAA